QHNAAQNPAAPSSGTPSAQSPSAQSRGAEVKVTRVRVYIKDRRLQAFVQGELGDGCTKLDRVTQRRRGDSAVDITVTSKREGEVCTMIPQFLKEGFPQDGVFKIEDYRVTAKNAEVFFRLVVSERGPLRSEPDPGPFPPPPYLPF